MQPGATIDGEMYLQLLDDWPLLIGRFICAFSSCEYWTYFLLRFLGDEDLSAAFANTRLDVRVDKIKELAKGRGVGETEMKQLTEALGELKWLGELRNLVGHNAPMAHIYQDQTTQELEIRMELRATHKHEKQATKENLQIWFTRARQLEERLAMLPGVLSRASR